MVLFPALRQSGEAQVSRFYTIARDLLGVLFPLVYVLYFPLVWILGLWLPDYKDSLIYFAFLLPICVFDSKMNITSTTLFKVRRNETTLLRINLVTVCFSIIGSLIGGYLLHSVYFIIAIMVIAIAGRSIFSEWYLTRAFRAPKTKIVYGEVVLTLAFIALATFTSTPIAIVSYLGLYGIFIALFKGTLKTLHRGLKSSLSHTRG
jgi:O-antigen/teichoic acid export membrane protein